jgi:hypothetical protein
MLVVLVAVALLLMERPGERSASGETGELLATLDSAGVDKIEIKLSSGQIVLEKKGIEWYLQSPIHYRADQSNVASLISQARKLRVKATVSSNPENQSLFQVDSTGTLVKVYERGSQQSSFVIGKPGPSFSETYVRKETSNDVHLVDGMFSYMFNRSVNDWRDKSVASMPRDMIKEVKYQYGDTTFTLAFHDSVWRIGNAAVKDSEINMLLSTLADVKADDFVDIPPTPAPRFRIVISYGDVQLRFAEIKGENKYYLQSSTSPQLFELQQWRANQILKRRNDLVQ